MSNSAKYYILFIFILFSATYIKAQDIPKAEWEKQYKSVDKTNPEVYLVQNQDKKFGFMRPNGDVVLKPIYVVAKSFINGKAIAALEHEKYGLIDMQGNWFWKPIYYHIWSLEDNLFIANTEYNEANLLDINGKKINKNSYTSIEHDFIEDLIQVVNNQNLKGFMDRNGNEVIACQYKLASLFSEGLSAVTTEDNDNFYIDKNNHKLKNDGYQAKGYFYNGIAIVTNDKKGCNDKKYGIVNNLGDLVFPVEYSYIDRTSDFMVAKHENHSLLVNNFGKILDTIQDFNTDFRFPLAVQKNNKWGFMNKKGELEFNYIYDHVDFFGLHETPIRVSKNGKWGIMDKEYQFLLPIEFDKLNPFGYNSTVIASKNGKFGILDSQLKTVIEFKYHQLSNFTSLDSIIMACPSKAKCGFINQKEQVLLPFEYDFMDNPVFAPLMSLSKNGKFGLVNSKNVVLVPFLYDAVIPKGDAAVVFKNYKCGLVDLKGKILIPMQYENIEHLEGTDFAFVQSNEKWGVLDYKGIQIVPFELEELPALNNIKGDPYTRANLKPYIVLKKGEFKAYYLKKSKTFTPFIYEDITTYKRCFVLSKSGIGLDLYDTNGKLLLSDLQSTNSIFNDNGILFQTKQRKSGIIDSLNNIHYVEFDYIKDANNFVSFIKYNRKDMNDQSYQSALYDAGMTPIIPFQNAQIAYDKMYNDTYIFVSKPKSSLVFHKDGGKPIQTNYDGLNKFNIDYFVAYNVTTSETSSFNLTGLIDKNGNTKIPFSFAEIIPIPVEPKDYDPNVNSNDYLTYALCIKYKDNLNRTGAKMTLYDEKLNPILVEYDNIVRSESGFTATKNNQNFKTDQFGKIINK